MEAEGKRVENSQIPEWHEYVQDDEEELIQKIRNMNL